MINWNATHGHLIVEYYSMIENDIDNIDFYTRALEYELECADVSSASRSYDWLRKLKEIKDYYCTQLRKYFECSSREQFF